MTDVQNLRSELDKLNAPTGQLKTDATEAGKEAYDRLRAKDRSAIALIIAFLYAGVISVSIIFLVVRGWCCNVDTFDDISELIKIAVIPIVTLVMGYYFAQSK
jgi:polyphosphate kinase